MDDIKLLLEELLRQEEELQFRGFDYDDALRLGLKLVERAKELASPVTTDICRNGLQLFHCALRGTSADNDLWIRRKNNVGNHYGHSFLYVGAQFRSKGSTFEQSSRLDSGQYAAHGGAFPIIVRNVGVVGPVTVSGLPQEEDHRLVLGVLRDYLTA